MEKPKVVEPKNDVELQKERDLVPENDVKLEKEKVTEADA